MNMNVKQGGAGFGRSESQRFRAIARAVAPAIFACVMLALAGIGGLAAQSAPDAPIAPSAASRWDTRLAALDPLRPMDYLELGEEVADAATNDADRRLARELFGYAGALDSARLGRSAMLALAAIAETPGERMRASSAAELVGGRGAARTAFSADPAQIEALSRAISFHRRGDGRKALAALRQDDADALLDKVGEPLAGTAKVFREECKAMRSNSGAVPIADIVRRGLLVELALRSGDLRPPALDIALLGDAPLIEIDLADPMSTWRVDPSKPWWRNGHWSGNG